MQDQNGLTVRLDDLRGQKAIVYFYPKDDTPGCTTEACSFRDSLNRIQGAKVFGVSPDSVKSHKKFADKFGLNFTLLSDNDHNIADEVGVWVEKSMYGRTYMGVDRTTFLLDENGIVEKRFDKVKPQGHVDEVLAALG
jgi:peroxiredoxin Q/BCP